MTGVAPAAPVTPVPNATTNNAQGGTVSAATPGTVPQSATLAATVVNPPAALGAARGRHPARRPGAGARRGAQPGDRQDALRRARRSSSTTRPPRAAGWRSSSRRPAPTAGRCCITVDPPASGSARGDAGARGQAPQDTSGNLSNPPATLARLPAGTAIEGRVLPSDQRGQTQIQTSHGVLTLRSAAPLPAGARVAVQIQPNPSGVAGVLPVKVTVVALPPAARRAPPPNPAATIVLSPGAQAGNAAATGPTSSAQAAVVGVAPAVKLEPGTVVEGRVVGPDGHGAVIVQTAQGPACPA